MKSSRNLKVYLHAIDTSDYCRYVAERVTNAFIESELIDHADIEIYCYYDPRKFDWLHHKLKRWPRCRLLFPINMPEESEIPTIRTLKEFVDSSTEPCNILYLHLKGTGNFRLGQHDWCDLMLHFNVIRWREAVDILNEGYDTCGVNWNANHEYPHYAGNFWWARSEYLKSLPPFTYPDPDTITWDSPSIFGFNNTYRHDAEYWLGMNEPKAYSIYDSGVDHYSYYYPSFLYR